MSGSQHPPKAPHAPMQGGRDRDALQARGVRRLEARAVLEQRQAGESPLQRIPSLDTSQSREVSPMVGRVRTRGAWLHAALDPILRRSGGRWRR